LQSPHEVAADETARSQNRCARCVNCVLQVHPSEGEIMAACAMR
jgi:hypothetical protein